MMDPKVSRNSIYAWRRSELERLVTYGGIMIAGVGREGGRLWNERHANVVIFRFVGCGVCVWGRRPTRELPAGRRCGGGGQRPGQRPGQQPTQQRHTKSREVGLLALFQEDFGTRQVARTSTLKGGASCYPCRPPWPFETDGKTETSPDAWDICQPEDESIPRTQAKARVSGTLECIAPALRVEL